MMVNFTIFEIFEIAEQIESNGMKFYRQAAEKAGDKFMKEFFLQLAEMESGHKARFAEMRKNLENDGQDANVFDPNNEVVYYLKAMATSAGWEGKAMPQTAFTGSETITQIIKSAIEAEKASINYYVGLKEFVRSQAGKQQVQEIIKEEMSHVVTLQKHLEQLES